MPLDVLWIVKPDPYLMLLELYGIPMPNSL